MSDDWVADLIEAWDGEYDDVQDLFIAAGRTSDQSAVVVFTSGQREDETGYDPDLEAISYVVAWQRADAPHKVKIGENGWVIRHPLACRPDLFGCIYNNIDWDEPPAPIGIYPVTIGPGPGEAVLGERCT